MAEKNGFRVWDQELERDFFSAEEIKASNDRVARMEALIKVRKELEISQRDSKCPMLDTLKNDFPF